MRIKKTAEAKHEATKSPATTEFLKRALSGSLLDFFRALRDFPRPWSEPRGYLYHWIPLLNAFDLILSEFNTTYDLTNGPQKQPFTDRLLREGVRDEELHIELRGVGSEDKLQPLENDEGLICAVLDFGRLLLDNCANRTLYNSSEHVEPLLNSTSSLVVASALHLGSRFAATYLRSNHHPTPRTGFNSNLLQIHYRISTDHVQKLAEPFSAHLQRHVDVLQSQPQTPVAKVKEPAQQSAKKGSRQSAKVHPSDLVSLIREVTDPSLNFSEYGDVYFDVDVGSSKDEPRFGDDVTQSGSNPPLTPTPTRRSTVPSRLSRTTNLEDANLSQDASEDRERGARSSLRRMLMVSSQEIEDTDVTQLMKTYLPQLPTSELQYAFLSKVRFAKSMLQSLETRRLCVAIRILALTNVAFLYSEHNFSQKILQQDSQLPRELQIVYQLAELAKPGDKSAPAYLKAIALEALEAITIKHRSKHPDICNALGITVNHGIIFQLLREVEQDLREGKVFDATMLEKHERIFNLLESLRGIHLTSRSGRSSTMDTLVSAGLFGILVDILAIRSEKAQHAQYRIIVFIHEGSRQTRDGIRMFANASGLDTLSDLIAWEVTTCLDAVAAGKGISPAVKSKVMDYSVPIWNQQTLRSALKFVNYLLSQQTVHVERLLRNLIDSPHLLRSINQIIANSKVFGSNIYANTINMVSTFIHNEPTSYSVIQEAGISSGLLNSISSSDDATVSGPPTRRLPVKKSREAGQVVCGEGEDSATVGSIRSRDEQLASNILCSTDVLLNLPHAFGALCLTSQGLQLFLSTRALESYFEVFESPMHVRTIASEKDLATYIGNAFDELVRHHPNLKTAVLQCFLLTLARLINKCSHLTDGITSQLEDDVNDTKLDFATGTENSREVKNEQVKTATYISIFCRFMNGFFGNQQMATSFLDQGGLPFVLDLCNLPSLPYNFVSDPGNDVSYDLTKTVHMLAEAKPAQTIPVILTEAQKAVRAALATSEALGKAGVLRQIVNGEHFEQQHAVAFASSLAQCLLFVNILQEMLSHTLYPHQRERTWSPLAAVNATEMWIDVITQVGKLNRFCVWEALCLFDNAPPKLAAITRVRANGIGSEADKVLGISFNLPPYDYSVSDQNLVFPSASHVITTDNAENGHSMESSTEPLHIPLKTAAYTMIIRHLLVTIPNVTTTFYWNVGSKAVIKRMRDYLRQNMFMIVEAIAKSVMAHLSYELPSATERKGHALAYKVVVADMIRRTLNVNDVDGGPPSHFMTLLFLALRNNGLLPILSQILSEATADVLKHPEESEQSPTVGESMNEKVNCARSLVHVILILFGCFVSSRYVADSSQSTTLNSSPNDPTPQFAFNPQQTLLESRAAILPAIRQAWETDGAENLSSSNIRRIVRILRTILEADSELTRFNKRHVDVPAKQRAKHRTLSLIARHLKTMEQESRANGPQWDRDLICEALYRCNNDIEAAKDYAEARVRLDYPRFPPPRYDLDLRSTKPPASPPRRDSQSTIPDQEAEQDTTARATNGAASITDTAQEQEAVHELSNAGSMSSSETDDDGRMAMSIDNVLNITEQSQLGHRQAEQIAKSSDAEDPTTVGPLAPPLEIALFSERISIEDLDNVRAQIRTELILHVMEVLGAHDSLTVDLAELLSTAANKSEETQQTKEEFGETLIQALISFRLSDDFRENQKNIAAYANLLARLMQDKEFYEACRSTLFNKDAAEDSNNAVDDLLGYVRVFPNTTPEESHPWIGHVLLIFEKLLSEELQPRHVTFTPPTGDAYQPSSDPVAGYVDPLLKDNQREQLFASLVELLPHIGKDQSLALSVVRTLAMLTRHESIAQSLASKQNLQRLFLMVKQMAGINIEHIQSSFLLILRHISEDQETLRRTMRNAIIESFSSYPGAETTTLDTNRYVRTHVASILRAPKTFIEVTNETVELTRFDNEQRQQVLALRTAVKPQTFTAWQSQHSPSHKPAENSNKLPGTADVVQSTEGAENQPQSLDKSRAEIKPPVVERPDGVIHFLLSQLLLYRSVEDKDIGALKKEAVRSEPLDDHDSMPMASQNSNDESATANSSDQQPNGNAVKPEKKEEYKAEDHPIYHYRCFLLQCLTELLMSYNQAKVEFINFSRKSDPKATTPSKPRSGVLNYLLGDLIPVDQLTRDNSVTALKKQGTSTWAMSVVVALCIRTPETYLENRDSTMEAKDSDLLFVRRFVIEHAVKSYRDVQSATDLTAETRYGRMLSLSDLFNRILMGRVVAVHSSMEKQAGETERAQMHKTQVARIMYEKNLISVLTASCSEIDLTVPNAKRAVKYVLRPLKTLTFTAIEYSKESDTSTTPGQTTEDDDISTATSISDISDEREETPDLFRHSALGMLDAGRGDEDESDQSDDEDEEMYDDGYGEGMEYDDDMDQVDDDEAVSDPEEDDEDMGPIEGRNGDMVLDVEVINSDADGSEDDGDSDDDDESDEDGESDDDDDDDMDDMDEDDVEIYEEVEDGDGESLDDDHEHDWRDVDDDEDDEGDDTNAGLVEGTIPAEADALINNVFGGDLSGGNSNFTALNDDIESGRYMADMELIRDEEDDHGEDEDEEGFLEDEDADDEDALMYETYDDEEDDDMGFDMDEAFELITGRPGRHRHHHHHTHDHHAFHEAGFGRSGELTFLTTNWRPGMLPPHQNAMRMHRGNGPAPRGSDEGLNPLLARTQDDVNGDDSARRQSTAAGRIHNRVIPSLVQAVLGGPSDRGGFVGGLVPDILSRHGGWAAGGNIMINTEIPEDIEFMLGADPRTMRFDLEHGLLGQRPFGASREDVAQPPRFTPLSTTSRWQEEARMLFPSNAHVEIANIVILSILKVLAPEAKEKERLRELEEQKRLAEEAKRREEEERKRKEQEREEKEKAEKEKREREEQERQEQQRREEEAAGTDLHAGSADSELEVMDVDPTTSGVTQPPAGSTAAGQDTSQQRNRVTTTLRDREVDITDLGIDADFIAELPEDLREEVVMGALQNQRAQTAEAGQPPADLNPEFLNALPDDLREEIIQQEQSERRRRERQEARRREQEASGGAPPRAEEMDLGSFLATLDPELRRTVLLEDNIDETMLSTLPASFRRDAEEANAARQHYRVGIPHHNHHHHEHHGMPGRAGIDNSWREGVDQNRSNKHRPIVQMLDKQGIATVLRLLFIPQQGSLKDSLNTVFVNLAQNRQNRTDLISLLLSILQDSSSDPVAVERSYASISIRAKQKEGSQMTPKQLRRTLTGGSASNSVQMSPEMTPAMVLTQALGALGHLSQCVPSVQTFFVNEHETSSTLKRKGKGKDKERDTRAQKFALNALLTLLDKKMIMDDASCMEHLSNLLQHVTQPLTILLRREREEREREAKEKKEREEGEKAETEARHANQTGEPADHASGAEAPDQSDTQNAGSNIDGQRGSDAGDGAKDREKAKAEEKKQRTLIPPVIPEMNLRLVINIITARECNGKIFRDTIGIINNLSAIPGAKDVFGKELVKQAQELGDVLASDLTELLQQLNRDKEHSTVGSSVLSKFSPASSDQTKLLRVLTALDYLFDPKRNATPSTDSEPKTPESKSRILSSLYDNPTFTPVWNRLSDCLKAIRGKENVTNVATILLPLVEALMVVCKNTNLKDTSVGLAKSQHFRVTSPEPESESMDTLFFRFTEDHRKILNDLVRNNPKLMSGTFSLLVNNPKVLEFDNKRNYFTRKLHTRDDARRSQPTLQLNVRRDMIFTDSYKLLYYKRWDEMKYGKLNIKFSGEEGVDAGGVTREWFQAISRQMFDPNWVLFVPVASDRTTFHPNRLSQINPDHLSYFKFIGRIIGKAMYEGRPLDCHFSRAVYKRILGNSVSIKDMETLDLDYYKSLLWMLENDITDVLTETFSVENEVFGEIEIVDLVENGRNIPVTDENKHEFVQKVVEYRLTGSIQEQLEHFLRGFHDIVPANLVSIFNEQELELLISGLPEIDIDDWKANTEYHNYNQGSAQIQWFWRAVRSFDKEERAKLLQFVTGTSKVPLNGFKELEGMNGFSKFNIHRDYGEKDRLPSSHTCFNQLDLPEYDDYETLRARLYTAMTAGGEYFGFA